MSGKPQFDETAVIDAAMTVFWRHGYAAASINQLTAATGLSRSSLYQRFQDKDGLFREALANYTERVLRRMGAANAPSRRGQLEALLRDFLPKEATAGRPPGCMLARSGAEMGELTTAGRQVALEGLARQRAVILEILRAAILNGELTPDTDVEGLAWHFLGALQAVMNLPQAGASPAALRSVVDLSMLAWPAASL